MSFCVSHANLRAKLQLFFDICNDTLALNREYSLADIPRQVRGSLQVRESLIVRYYHDYIMVRFRVVFVSFSTRFRIRQGNGSGTETRRKRLCPVLYPVGDISVRYNIQ